MNRFSYFKPSLSQSILIAVLLMAGCLLMGIILGLISSVTPSSISDCQSLTYLLSMVLPFLYIFIKAGDARKCWSAPEKINRSEFGLTVFVRWFAITAVALVALSVLVEPVTAFIPMSDSFKALFEKIFYESPLWDSILSTCILAPLCEEFLCRGMMLRGMLATGTPRRAIIWSAALFAIMHLNPWQSIPAFAMGLFFGWIYYRTGSLWLTIALHCFNNSLSSILARLVPDMGVDEGFIDLLPAAWYAILYAGCLVIFILSIRFLSRIKDEKTLSA